MKKCKLCGIEKEFNEFYTHPKTKDGYLQKCKACAKEQSDKRYKQLSENPDFLEKERKRQREKDSRIKHKKRTIEQNRKSRQQFREQFPEKSRAYNHSRRLQKNIGMELHHWSYNQEHYTDCIELSPKDHKKAHRFIKYDQERYMYRDLSGILLDTKERHEKYIKFMIETQEN